MDVDIGDGGSRAKKEPWEEADDEFKSMKLSSTASVRDHRKDGSEEVAEDVVGKILSQDD